MGQAILRWVELGAGTRSSFTFRFGAPQVIASQEVRLLGWFVSVCGRFGYDRSSAAGVGRSQESTRWAGCNVLAMGIEREMDEMRTKRNRSARRLSASARYRRWVSRPLPGVLVQSGMIGGALTGGLFAVGGLVRSSILGWLFEPGAPPLQLVVLTLFLVVAVVGVLMGLLCAIGALVCRLLVIRIVTSRRLQSIPVGIGAIVGAAVGAFLLAPVMRWEPIVVTEIVGVLAAVLLCSLTLTASRPTYRVLPTP
jgi:hypothetical protein